LIVCAIGLALDNELLAGTQQSQENININAVIGQVADIDLGGTDLSSGIPKKMPVAWIAGSRGCICLIKEQAG
jgi:hypothetical protein